jgi:lipopolysaccharide/colanic/teichoic acid biosynthesis glycosyltransferase
LATIRAVQTKKDMRDEILEFNLDPLPVVDEQVFRRMLSLERRRCERTGIPLGLVLLNVEQPAAALGKSAVEDIALALSAAMRDTDTTGWYEQDSIIGIILTALNGADRHTLESIVVERAKKILSRNLDAAQMQGVLISCHVFPESDSGSSDTRPDRTFYSDCQKQDFKSRHAAAMKRTTDLIGSLAALVVLSPLFVVSAVLVWMTSPGPVFFRQKRVGQYGEEFTFLKFRSMYVNNDPAIHKEYVRNLIHKNVGDSGGTYKIKNDPRVTPIGRLLRKSSLDELPQFINVLKGDMSLVGPRPPIPYELESYSLWHRRRILEAKPGITGAWQVEGRSRTTFDEMVRMDLRYIRSQSVWLDLKILLKTPRAVLNGNGAS